MPRRHPQRRPGSVRVHFVPPGREHRQGEGEEQDRLQVQSQSAVLAGGETGGEERPVLRMKYKCTNRIHV